MAAGEPTGEPRAKRKNAPADFMLDDLTSAGYDVVKLSSIRASDFGICQSRPRTLFFGVRQDQFMTAEAVAGLFKIFAHQ